MFVLPSESYFTFSLSVYTHVLTLTQSHQEFTQQTTVPQIVLSIVL